MKLTVLKESGAGWPGNNMTTIKSEQLPNGLEISFIDQTNRYFGDYHRVCVVATIRCPVTSLRDESIRSKARELYGDSFDVERRFEKMGVSSGDVEFVRDRLVDDFMSHVAAYLGRDDYPDRLATAELKKQRMMRTYG